MHCLATIRIALLGAALAFTIPASADSDLDRMIERHVMPRFDQQARIFISNSGARFVSSSWNSETRTLIAVGEMERRLPAGPLSVAHAPRADAGRRELKEQHVAELCRHPNVGLIGRFLEKHEVTIALVYDREYPRRDPMVVEISHGDLSGCV